MQTRNLLILRQQVRKKLREQGKSLRQIASVIDAVDAEAVKECGNEMGIAEIGDGSILKQLLDAFLAFLKSEQGQALIDALLKLLLSFLV